MTTTPSPSPGPDPSAPVAAEIIRDVSELPDRTSPPDQPDLLQVTVGELYRILTHHLATLQRQPAPNECTLGVGGGSGNLFVHGSYESVKQVQTIIFEWEKLKKPAPSAESLESDFGKIACTISILKYKASSWSNETNNMVEETLNALSRIWAALRQPAPQQDKAMSMPLIYNGDHAEFEQEWAGRDPKSRPDWPLPSFDARDWAEAFCTKNPGIDEGLMLAWFANALMRGFDEARSRQPAPHTAPSPEISDETIRTVESIIQQRDQLFPNPDTLRAALEAVWPAPGVTDEMIRAAVSAYEKWTNRPQPWPATWRYDAIGAALEAALGRNQ